MRIDKTSGGILLGYDGYAGYVARIGDRRPGDRVMAEHGRLRTGGELIENSV